MGRIDGILAIGLLFWLLGFVFSEFFFLLFFVKKVPLA
jgi:hypothetical protein